MEYSHDDSMELRKWRIAREEALAAHASFDQSGKDLFRASIDFGLEAIRTAALTNGGAVLAALLFLACCAAHPTHKRYYCSNHFSGQPLYCRRLSIGWCLVRLCLVRPALFHARPWRNEPFVGAVPVYGGASYQSHVRAERLFLSAPKRRLRRCFVSLYHCWVGLGWLHLEALELPPQR
ncbi:hypothetical protein SAMN04515648_2527 [Phyllobacterium sp. CL33Tsu]|nr:hypothetical protein SAMN04515648_2527 [Phyllobacterium sp. CL33Tsu]